MATMKGWAGRAIIAAVALCVELPAQVVEAGQDPVDRLLEGDTGQLGVIMNNCAEDAPLADRMFDIEATVGLPLRVESALVNVLMQLPDCQTARTDEYLRRKLTVAASRPSGSVTYEYVWSVAGIALSKRRTPENLAFLERLATDASADGGVRSVAARGLAEFEDVEARRAVFERLALMGALPTPFGASETLWYILNFPREFIARVGPRLPAVLEGPSGGAVLNGVISALFARETQGVTDEAGLADVVRAVEAAASQMPTGALRTRVEHVLARYQAGRGE